VLNLANPRSLILEHCRPDVLALCICQYPPSRHLYHDPLVTPKQSLSPTLLVTQLLLCPVTSSFSMAMHLASMVHGSVRERDAFQQPPSSAYYQHTHSRGYSAPTGPPNPYTRQAQQYPYQREHPQSPPSPPAEKKPSLPSISSLLEIAGGENTASESGKTCSQ
jgi:hypothetical protein